MGRKKKRATKKSGFKIKKYFTTSKTKIIKILGENAVVRNSVYIMIIFAVFSGLGLIKFGPVKLSNPNYITVTGTHTSLENNQVANFVITITDINPDKDTAVNSVVGETKKLVEIIDNFGINPFDVKTTHNTVYQVTDNSLEQTARGITQQLWRASSTIEVKVRDVNRVESFLNLAQGEEKTEIFGPNYSIDNDKIDDARLLVEAIKEAQEKAKFIAKNYNKHLGKMLSIEEVGLASVRPMGNVLGLGSGMGNENLVPGATEVTKTVQVKFELR